MSAIIFMNVWFRVITLGLSGLLLTAPNLMRSAIFIPIAVLAMRFGSGLQTRISPRDFGYLFSGILLLSGLLLIPKAMTH